MAAVGFRRDAWQIRARESVLPLGLVVSGAKKSSCALVSGFLNWQWRSPNLESGIWVLFVEREQVLVDSSRVAIAIHFQTPQYSVLPLENQEIIKNGPFHLL